MTGAEIVVKQGNQFGYFKFRHDGYFIEDYLIGDKNNLKGKTVPEVLKHIIDTFMATYGDPAYEIDTFYRQGFLASLSGVDFYLLNLTGELNSVNESLEKELVAELTAKGFDEDEEGLLCGYGDYMVYLDLDDQKIYGLYNDDGNQVVYDFDYNLLEETNEG